MAGFIIYLKRDQPDSGEEWQGTIAAAKEHARRRIRSGKADQVMFMNGGKMVFHYPVIGARA